MDKKITVTGKGAIHVVPDITRLEVTIATLHETYSDAYEMAKKNLTSMVKILEYNNKPGSLAKTVSMDIIEHEYSVKDAKGYHAYYEKDGYELHQKIKVDLGVDNVLVNKIVRGVGKFIEEAQIKIGHTVQDPRPYQLKMLERAVKDAKEKAKIMASALGCSLQDVFSINYSDTKIHIYSEARNIHSAAEAKASTPEGLDITPEDLSVSDEVTVEWTIENKQSE